MRELEVLVAPTASSLVTQAEAEAYLGEALGATADLRLAAATREVEALCAQVLRRATYRERTTGSGRDVLLLSRFPLVAVASVSVDDVALDSGSYEVMASVGALHRTDGDVWPAPLRRNPRLYTVTLAPDPGPNVVVEYEAGYADGEVPDDLRLAVLRVLEYRLRRGVGVKAMRAGQASVTYLDERAGATEDGWLRADVLPLVAPYRVAV